MVSEPCRIDPRVKRTRQMFFVALKSLLQEKSFEEISVQDLADRSTLNRATFYDHFTDKFALLEAMIDESFRERIFARMEASNGTCEEGLRQLVLSVCDFLGEHLAECQKVQRQFDPVVETRIKTVVRDFLAKALRFHNATEDEVGLHSTMASWAICGAAFDWKRERRMSAEALAESVLPLVQPLLKM
ncbi:MAG: TetR/AcrR family transcriptional regulator [Verrucomicrobiota bacterium]